MSLNCQSIQAKFSPLKILVDTFAGSNTQIQVLCLQGTWFENTDLIDLGIYQIENCHFVTHNRYASAHGGLAFYIHHNWNYKIKSNEIDSPYWEELFIEVTYHANPKSKFNIANFYRPPHSAISQLTSFLENFTRKLPTINPRETTLACGNFNINLLSLNTNEHCNAYLEGTLSSGFLPTKTLPIRLSKNGTLIDNIFLNKQEKLNFAGILHNEISDHHVITINMNLVLPPQKTVYATVFSNNDQSKQNFKNDFETKNIYERLNTTLDANPNENYCILETAIIESMSNHLNEKVVKFN